MIKLAGKGFSGLDDFTIKPDKELPAQSNETRSANTVQQRPVDVRIKEDNPQRPQQNYTNTQRQSNLFLNRNRAFSRKQLKL